MTEQDLDLHRIVTTAIIYKGNKYLITQRPLTKKAFAGMWTVPGGGLSFNDYVNTPKTTNESWYFSLDRTLRREIKEEVNLEIGDLQYLLDLTFIRPDNIPVIVLSFFAPYKSGIVKLDQDSTNYTWVTAKEAGEYNLIEGIKEEIIITDRILKGEKISDRAKLFSKLLGRKYT